MGTNQLFIQLKNSINYFNFKIPKGKMRIFVGLIALSEAGKCEDKGGKCVDWRTEVRFPQVWNIDSTP